VAGAPARQARMDAPIFHGSLRILRAMRRGMPRQRDIDAEESSAGA